MTGNDRSFMRVREVAGHLGISPSRAYRLIAMGAIPAVQVGGRIVIPRAAWDKWIAATCKDALASLKVTPSSAAGWTRDGTQDCPGPADR